MANYKEGRGNMETEQEKDMEKSVKEAANVIMNINTKGDKIMANYKEIKVVAYEGRGNNRKEVGVGKVKEYAENQDGLNQAVKDIGVAKVIHDLNRQLKTDCRNDLARTVSDAALLKKAAKSSPEAQKKIEALLRELGLK